ncbi:MAG: hypothetical protein ACREPM_25350 [Gemmatimonadaceae bacterium]
MTKAGNGHCRHALVQAAWSYHHRPAVSVDLKRRQSGQPRSLARSPWSAPPHIRFLYVAPQVSRRRCFQRVTHVPRLAVYSGRCDPLPPGLPPVSQCSCWAHHKSAGEARAIHSSLVTCSAR